MTRRRPPLVVVEVRGGNAYVTRKPRGVAVVVRDYDGEGGGENNDGPPYKIERYPARPARRRS